MTPIWLSVFNTESLCHGPDVCHLFTVFVIGEDPGRGFEGQRQDAVFVSFCVNPSQVVNTWPSHYSLPSKLMCKFSFHLITSPWHSEKYGQFASPHFRNLTPWTLWLLCLSPWWQLSPNMVHGSLPGAIIILDRAYLLIPYVFMSICFWLIPNDGKGPLKKGQLIMSYFKNISCITGTLHKCSKKSQADKFYIS